VDPLAEIFGTALDTRRMPAPPLRAVLAIFAFAALFIWGYRLWPGVFLGAFLVNIAGPGGPARTIDIAAGNTLEALLGAWLIHQFANGRKVFERARKK
jgi:integral membrane sensor domain MASE1